MPMKVPGSSPAISPLTELLLVLPELADIDVDLAVVVATEERETALVPVGVGVAPVFWASLM